MHKGNIVMVAKETHNPVYNTIYQAVYSFNFIDVVIIKISSSRCYTMPIKNLNMSIIIWLNTAIPLPHLNIIVNTLNGNLTLITIVRVRSILYKVPYDINIHLTAHSKYIFSKQKYPRLWRL